MERRFGAAAMSGSIPAGSPDRRPTEVSLSGETLLVTVSGADRPGVTRQLFEGLAGHDVVVLDLEQVVIRGQLTLGILVGFPDGVRGELDDVASTVASVAGRLGMTAAWSRGMGDQDRETGPRLLVTVLGAPLRPASVAAVAGRIAEHGGNIDRIDRIAPYPVTALELVVSGPDPDELRTALATEAVRQHVDIAVQRAGLDRRAKRLVVLDVDSTLIQGEVIEMLAERAGCLTEVGRITDQAMRGELDFAASLRARVALLTGLPAAALDEVRDNVTLTPGARTLVRTLKRLGYAVAVVSGGFTCVTDALVDELDLDFSLANELEVADGALTGRVVGAVVDRAEKAAALRRFADAAGVPLTQTVAIGDGANDLDMLDAAGLGVAFNAKPVVRAAADASVNVPYLDAILFLLGIPRDEVDAAEADDVLR
jgi:phosphoserine phosphatase